jgi:hypothetical protein
LKSAVGKFRTFKIAAWPFLLFLGDHILKLFLLHDAYDPRVPGELFAGGFFVGIFFIGIFFVGIFVVEKFFVG